MDEEMEVYQSFAQVYDLFMEDVPYAVWCGRLAGLLESWGIADGLVLDLGCGTGSMTARLAGRGYDMIGVDASAEMLQQAIEKKPRDQDILYLQQDMRSFELYGTVRAVVSVCDSLNYILTEEELLQVFRLVNNYLDPGGIFLFDMHTVFQYEQVLADHTYAEVLDRGSYIWQNAYDPAEQINEYQLTLFIREEDCLYRRFDEVHVQKGYTIDVLQRLLAEAGLVFMDVYDAYTDRPPGPESTRVLLMAHESGKNPSCTENSYPNDAAFPKR